MSRRELYGGAMVVEMMAERFKDLSKFREVDSKFSALTARQA